MPYNQWVSNSCEGVIVLSHGKYFTILCNNKYTNNKVCIVHYLNASYALGIIVSLLCILSHLILIAICEVEIIVSMLQMKKPSLRDV